MPDLEAITRQTDDETLREGLKHMFSKVAAALLMSSRSGADDFMQVEEKAVDAFISGLRFNGYDIVKKEA